MSDDRHIERGYSPDSSEGRAVQALRRLPRAQASEPARERARAAFLGAAPSVEVLPVRPREAWFRTPAAFAAMAAAACVALFLFGRTPSQEWVVLDVVQPGGVQHTQQTTLAVGARLLPGLIATADSTELEIQLGDKLRFRMLPGTSVTLPRAPGRWFDRNREINLTSGELYGTSGGQKLGFGLTFTTDELRAELTGTTFAVFRTPERSCVCLWEGAILVTPTAEPEAPTLLQPNQRIWIFKDGRPREIAPLDGMETMKLQMTADGGLAGSLPPAP